MITIIEETKSDFVSCNFYYSNRSKHIDSKNNNYNCIQFNREEAIIQLNSGVISVNVWNKLFRASFLKINGIKFSEFYCEDYEFMIDCIYHSKKVAYYNQPLYTYVLSSNSLSSGKGNEIAKRDVYLFDKEIKLFRGNQEILYELFCSTFIHILRSMTNTDYKTLRSLSKEPIIIEACTLSKVKKPEIILYKTNKLLFLIVGKFLRKIKYTGTVLFDKK